MTGRPSRTTSVTTATRLSVIFEKSMKALRMSDLMGRVDSRMSTIFMRQAYQLRCAVSPRRDLLAQPIFLLAQLGREGLAKVLRLENRPDLDLGIARHRIGATLDPL